MSHVDARLIVANVISSAGILVARCQCTFSQPRTQVFSPEAVGQLPGVTGLRALEAIQQEDSLLGFRVNLSGSSVVVA